MIIKSSCLWLEDVFFENNTFNYFSGPPGVGKTTLIKALIKHYTRQNVADVRGPITLVSGKARRLTFIECPSVQTPLNAYIDSDF